MRKVHLFSSEYNFSLSDWNKLQKLNHKWENYQTVKVICWRLSVRLSLNIWIEFEFLHSFAHLFNKFWLSSYCMSGIEKNASDKKKEASYVKSSLRIEQKSNSRTDKLAKHCFDTFISCYRTISLLDMSKRQTMWDKYDKLGIIFNSYWLTCKIYKIWANT